MGEKLTTYQGLCNIGEWHSHHRIGLPSPSRGDQTTVWKHMESVAGGRFLVFIASISGSKSRPDVNIGCFMFCSETRTMTEGLLTTLQKCSPIRGQFNDASFEPGPERGVSWVDFIEAIRKEIGDTIMGSHKVSQYKQLSVRPKGRPYEKTSTRQATDKTNLKSSTHNASYGSTNHSEVPKNMPSKPIKKTKSKKSSELKSDDVITKQPMTPMRDLVSPCPTSGSNDGSKSPSIFAIFDCCIACKCNKYNRLNEEEYTTMFT